MSKLHGECILLMSFFSTFASLFFRGWFYKLALLVFELIFEVKMQESEGV